MDLRLFLHSEWNRHNEVDVTDGFLSALRQWISGQFGRRFQSTDETAVVAQTHKLVETVGASPTNPYILHFDQFILDAFMNSAEEGALPVQFDLVERDASDVDAFEPDGEGGFNLVSGGESEVTIATREGFEDGETVGAWSRFAKVITSDKIYKVVFVPGSTGDGVYSVRVSGLNQG